MPAGGGGTCEAPRERGGDGHRGRGARTPSAVAGRTACLSGAQAVGGWANAFWIGPKRSLPNVPSRRGAAASSVAKADVHDHHHADHRVKPPRAGDVAVVDAPEDLQPGVDPLDRRAAVVQPLELLRGPRDGREPPQVDRAVHAHRLAVGLARVAHGVVRAVPAFVPRRAAVLDRLALRLVADVGHLVPHDRLARAVVAVQRARLVVDDVRACRRGRAASARSAPSTSGGSGSPAGFLPRSTAGATRCRRPPCRRPASSMRPAGQVRLGLLDQVRQRLAVGRVGRGHLVGQRHLVLGVDQQVQLVAEPLDDLGHLAVVVECTPSCRRWAAAARRRSPPSRPVSPLRPGVQAPWSRPPCPCPGPAPPPPAAGSSRRRSAATREACGSWPSTSRNREMFHALGTPASRSMPISRRRASLRLQLAQAWPRTLTCRKAIRSSTTPQSTCTG